MIRASLIFLACLAVACDREPTRPTLMTQTFGAQPLAVFAEATSIEVTRVQGWAGDELEVLSSPVVLDGAQRRELGELLQSSLYTTHLPNCKPNPGLRFVAKRGTATAELLVCLDCGVLWLGAPRATGAPVPEQPWLHFPELYFRHHRLALALFPDDPALRAL